MTIFLSPAIFGFRDLVTNLIPWPRPQVTNALVTHGICRCLRHPLYLSLIFLAVGWALWRQSWPALFSAAILTFIPRRKTAHEELLLRRSHARYADYARTTGRFLPRWRT